MKKVITIMMAITMMMTLFTATAQAAVKTGQSITDVDADGTNIFATGDSRTIQIFNHDSVKYYGYGQKGAFIGTWGGHYGVGTRIDTSAKLAPLKGAVEKHLKKDGKACVFVMATINDYRGGKAYETPVSKQMAMAKQAKKWNAVYKGKVVKPEVYCTSLVGIYGGKSVASYNKYLKKQLNGTGIKYLAITNGGKKGYALKENGFPMNDTWHYSQYGAKRIWASMKCADAGHVMKVVKPATLTANGTLKCTRCKKKAVIYHPASYKLSKTSYKADGTAKKPAVQIKNTKGAIIPAKYYSVTYKNNVNPGTAKAIIKFNTRYTGTKALKYEITKAENAFTESPLTLDKNTGAYIQEGSSIFIKTPFKITKWYVINPTVTSINDSMIVNESLSAVNLKGLTFGTSRLIAVKEDKSIVTCDITVARKTPGNVTLNFERENGEKVTVRGAIVKGTKFEYREKNVTYIYGEVNGKWHETVISDDSFNGMVLNSGSISDSILKSFSASSYI